MNRVIRTATALSVMVSCSLTARAQEACIARADFAALTTVGTHLMFKTYAKQCMSVPGSTLATVQPPLASKFEQQVTRDLPAAVRAILPLLAKEDDKPFTDILASSPDVAMKFAEAGIESAIAKDFTPEKCVRFEPLVLKLASLPDQDMLDVAGLVFELVATEKKSGVSKFTLCPRTSG